MKVKRYQINDKEYQFKSNALVPLNFYNEFNEDIFQLMEEISNFIANRQKTNENLRKKAENGEKVEFVSENLNPKQQEIISLKIISDLSFKDISKLLNENENTIKWRYYKNSSNK